MFRDLKQEQAWDTSRGSIRTRDGVLRNTYVARGQQGQSGRILWTKLKGLGFLGFFCLFFFYPEI